MKHITMKNPIPQFLIAATLAGLLAFTATIAQAANPLPSWNDGKVKQSIIDFVEKTTDFNPDIA